MFARSTIIQAQTPSMDAGIAHLRDVVMPELQQVDGYVGLSLLVDRQSGRCIATSSWQTEEAMQASESRVRDVRKQATLMFGSSDAKVERWEIAVMHRAHRSQDGACVRSAWLKVDQSGMDRAVNAYRGLLSRLETMAGFCSASLLIDRTSGRCVSTVTFDSQDRMGETRDQGTQMRNEVLRDAQGELIEVAEFELAMAHLRVPELV